MVKTNDRLLVHGLLCRVPLGISAESDSNDAGQTSDGMEPKRKLARASYLHHSTGSEMSLSYWQVLMPSHVIA